MTQPLKLDFNERSDWPSPLAATLPFGETLWQYPDRKPLEALIAEQNELLQTQVLATNGGDEAIMILMRLIKESATLILPLPAFSQYTWGVESWQLDAKLVPANADLSINLAATRQAIETTENSVTVITRPNNPTGEMLPINELIELLDAAKKQASWLFLDEAYIEFSDQGSVIASLLTEYENLVVLRTLSKAYGLAGIRLGYICGSEKLIGEFTQRSMPFNIPQPSLQIAMQALGEESRRDMQGYCQTIRNNRQMIFSWLKDNNIAVLSSEANFFTLRLCASQALAIKSFLSKNGILIRSFDNAELNGCLRITIPYNVERLMRLLQQALAPQLICLDMDGVLIDTSNSYDATVKATIKQLTDEIVPQSALNQLRSRGGFNNDWLLSQTLLQDLGYAYSLEQVTKTFQSIYLGTNNNGLVANEKALIDSNLVKRLNRANRVNFAVVTGRPKNEANAGCQLIGLKPKSIVSLDDVLEAKPSPEGILKLQSKYSSFSWMCGDNPDDMQAANASNSLAVGIGSNNAEALYQAGADIVLENINQLEEWLTPVIKS